MKTTLLAVLCTLAVILGSSNHSKACVDTHPDSVQVWILADTLCNIEIQLRNLQLFGGNPNEFCSCGVTGFFDVGIQIDYVGFADVETEDPIEGFNSWDYAAAAGTSWEDADPLAFDWSGYVSNVNASGLFAGQDVYMVIRGVDTNGNCVGQNSWPEVLSQSAFGTDEWDDANQELADSHQSITYFFDLPWENFTQEMVDYTYFESLDAVWLGTSEITPQPEFRAYPVPSHTQLTFQASAKIDLIEMRTVTGKIAFRTRPLSLSSVVDVSDFPQGIYLVSAHMNGIIRTRRIVVH